MGERIFRKQWLLSLVISWKTVVSTKIWRLYEKAKNWFCFILSSKKTVSKILWLILKVSGCDVDQKKTTSGRKYVVRCYKIWFKVTLISVFHIHSKQNRVRLDISLSGNAWYSVLMSLHWNWVDCKYFSQRYFSHLCFLTDGIWIVNTTNLKDKTCRWLIKHSDETNFVPLRNVRWRILFLAVTMQHSSEQKNWTF